MVDMKRYDMALLPLSLAIFFLNTFIKYVLDFFHFKDLNTTHKLLIPTLLERPLNLFQRGEHLLLSLTFFRCRFTSHRPCTWITSNVISS